MVPQPKIAESPTVKLDEPASVSMVLNCARSAGVQPEVEDRVAIPLLQGQDSGREINRGCAKACRKHQSPSRIPNGEPHGIERDASAACLIGIKADADIKAGGPAQRSDRWGAALHRPRR